MKIVSALDFGREMLQRSDTALSDVRTLLAHVLDVDVSYLLAHDQDLISAESLTPYLSLVARCEKHEPLPYILGSAAFRFLNLYVTPDVLIPRPETEQLVDEVLRWAKDRPPLTMVDIGTGSGCIAISLATELQAVRMSAVDISADALAIAQQNAQTNGAQITFYEGSLLAPITQPVDAIIANLPYITDAEMDALPTSVARFEPALALRGGEDGLDLIRTLLTQAKTILRPSGAVFLEIGYQQGDAAHTLAQAIFPDADVQLKQDYASQDRFVIIKTSS